MNVYDLFLGFVFFAFLSCCECRIKVILDMMSWMFRNLNHSDLGSVPLVAQQCCRSHEMMACRLHAN